MRSCRSESSVSLLSSSASQCPARDDRQLDVGDWRAAGRDHLFLITPWAYYPFYQFVAIMALSELLSVVIMAAALSELVI